LGKGFEKRRGKGNENENEEGRGGELRVLNGKEEI
jgi:hypothetical protein